MLLTILSQLPSTSTLGKIVRFPLRLLPKDTAVPIMLGPLKGRKWVVGAHTHGCWLGIYELELQRLIANEVAPGSIFYDVGANVGFYSLLASRLVGTGTVFSFEPVPANIACLERHLNLNQAHNVRILPVAIGDQPRLAQFHTESTGAMGKLNSDGDLTVHVLSLDHLLAGGEIPPPHAIKMDIEGAEYLALQGARDCFQKHRPKLFLATHDREIHDLCCDLLSSWNYELRPIGRKSDFEHAEVFAVPRDVRSLRVN